MEASRPSVLAGDDADPVTGQGDAAAAVAAAGARMLPADPPGWIRIQRPAVPEGPRRIGIQAGHWRTAEAPPELWRLIEQTGATTNGITEWETNLAIAERAAALLRERGYVVDILPTIISPGYVADAVVSLHSDADETGTVSGFKVANSTRRTPYDAALKAAVIEAYGGATGLPYDEGGARSPNLRNYYLNVWSRNRYSVSPFTPSVVLEMGFLTHSRDHQLIVNEQDRLARAIAQGILAFLEATPRDALFGQDLVVPPFRRPASPSPSPSP